MSRFDHRMGWPAVMDTIDAPSEYKSPGRTPQRKKLTPREEVERRIIDLGQNNRMSGELLHTKTQEAYTKAIDAMAKFGTVAHRVMFDEPITIRDVGVNLHVGMPQAEARVHRPGAQPAVTINIINKRKDELVHAGNGGAGVLRGRLRDLLIDILKRFGKPTAQGLLKQFNVTRMHEVRDDDLPAVVASAENLLLCKEDEVVESELHVQAGRAELVDTFGQEVWVKDRNPDVPAWYVANRVHLDQTGFSPDRDRAGMFIRHWDGGRWSCAVPILKRDRKRKLEAVLKGPRYTYIYGGPLNPVRCCWWLRPATAEEIAGK